MKKLSYEYVKYITNIENAVFRLQKFSRVWKNAIVILIPNTGKKPSRWKPSSYLPAMISGKGVRKYGFRRDSGWVWEEPYSCKRTKCSTEQQTLRLAETIITRLNQRYSYSAICTDVEKAFDTVWHEHIVYNMRLLATNLALFRFIADFLNSRSFQTRFGTCHSDKTAIQAGVSQRYMLSPMLYNIYPADIQIRWSMFSPLQMTPP